MIDRKPPQKWDEEADVVSGFAGLAAAIEAKQAGSSVIILENQLGPWTCPDEKGFGIGPDFASYVAFPYGIVVDPATGNRFDCLIFGRIAGKNAARQ